MLTHNFDACARISVFFFSYQALFSTLDQNAPATESARDAFEVTMGRPSRGGSSTDVTRVGALQNTIDQHRDDGDAVTKQRKLI